MSHQFDEIMIHNIIAENNFDRCKRKLILTCVLKGVLDAVCKLVCPKDPTFYKVKRGEDCVEKEKLEADELYHSILAKICKILIIAKNSENVCKILTNIGLVIRDCVRGEFIEEVCDAVKVLDGRCEFEEVIIEEERCSSEYLAKVNVIIADYNNGEIDCEELISRFNTLITQSCEFISHLEAHYNILENDTTPDQQESYSAFITLAEECC